MLFDGIILDCIAKIKDNRSLSGVFHLLVGKKSIQSVHDARIFQLEKYYGIYPRLNRTELQAKVNQLEEKGLIEKGINEGNYHITKIGMEKLEVFTSVPYYDYFDGLNYSGKATIFIERLYLLVQTFSNIQRKNTSFIPVVDHPEVTNWVRSIYKRSIKKDLPMLLFMELHDLLKNLPDEDAEILVDRLSGYQYYGMSIDQLAMKHDVTTNDVKTRLTAIIHRVIYLLEQEPKNYPILSQMIKVNKENRFITNTANQTYQLLLRHNSPSDIARIRNLKINTVYDHIVEIALYDSHFPIESFVSETEQNEIIEAINHAKTYKLKEIKENCQPAISYFQIRLVLTRVKQFLAKDGTHDENHFA